MSAVTALDVTNDCDLRAIYNCRRKVDDQICIISMEDNL